MSQKLNLSIHGLYTHPNPFSEVPSGALKIAQNLVIDRESVAESRRGYKQYGTTRVDINKLLSFNNKLILHDDNDLYRDSDDAGTWVAYTGTFNAPQPPIQMQGEEFDKSFFFTSDLGVYKLETTTSTPRRSGVSKALDISSALSGASGFLANNTRVAYRIVWGYEDANGKLILGSPSARHIVTNTAGGTRTVDLTFTVPNDITTSYFYQIYRSEQVPTTTEEPSDELQLVIQRPISAAQVTALLVTITDSITDDLKGPFIYTAASQEGILQSNDRPPLAVDLVEFRQHMFYARTKQPYRAIATMVANFVVADTVTIEGNVYTAAGAENIAADQFLVGASIDITMRSLIRVVNRSTTTDNIYLYEIDNKSFYAETRALPGASFTITSSNTGVFSRTVPITATQDDIANRVYISKLREPEGVPFTNFFDLGSSNKPIQRILAVRDAVFVMKDDGIFRITGTDIENFTPEIHDNTVIIVGPNTADTLDNQVFLMSNQGPAAVSVSGVNTLVGRPIEHELLQIMEFSNFKTVAWGLGYESDRKYILAVPDAAADTSAKKFYVYNFVTQSWTNWIFTASTAIVHPLTDKLYIGQVVDQKVRQERKAFDLTDYADDEYAVTITGSTSTTVTVSSVPSGVIVGMSLKQGTSVAVITAINGLVFTVDLAGLTWTAAAATVYTPIPVALQWVEEETNNPGILKHYSEVTFLFTDARFRELEVDFSSNFYPSSKLQTIRAKGFGNWDDFSWGDEQWGGGLGGAQPIRTYFPKEVMRANWVNMRLDLEQAFTALSLSGASLQIYAMSSKFR